MHAPLIVPINGITPSLAATAWIAPGVLLSGDVTVEDGVTVWFGTVVRGDQDPITIGRGSNIQDAAVLHTDAGFPLVIGRDVTVGHGAIVHGCTIADGALIGIGATVLSGATIGAGALVAAGALVREGQTVEPLTLVTGIPAVAKRAIDTAPGPAGAAWYRQNARRYADAGVGLGEPT